MGARISSGFTIIETMLFLAVTGLLVLGVLVGTGSALNNQRYRDAVETFKSLLQDQYAELGSIKNDRDDTWSCESDAKPVAGGSEIRGQSSCVIVGRYVAIQDRSVRVYTVLAHERASGITGENDIDTLRTKYNYNVVDPDVTPRNMEWGTSIAWPRSGGGSELEGTPRSLGILFIRSPESGSVYTFSGDTVPSSGDAINSVTFTSLMVAGNTIPGQGNRTVCVKSSGLFVGDDTAIAIRRAATGPSSIEVRSNATAVSIEGVGASQC